MNQFRILAIAATLMFASVSPAQQSASGSADADKQHVSAAAEGGSSVVDQHLKLLAEKLSLSADQQSEIRPILQQMLDARQKLMQDSSLSDDARQEKMKAVHDKADKKARKFLNEDQKNKLDQLEQEPHS
jgi:hypothetical protein